MRPAERVNVSCKMHFKLPEGFGGILCDVHSQIRKTEACTKFKSVNMTSSEDYGLHIRKNASPKWKRIMFPEE